MGIEKPVPCLSYKEMLKEQTNEFIVITTVGRLVRIKGYDILAEALISLPKNIKNKLFGVWQEMAREKKPCEPIEKPQH